MTCRPCIDELDHCHAALLLHSDGTWECADGCDGARLAHDHEVDCWETGCGCGVVTAA